MPWWRPILMRAPTFLVAALLCVCFVFGVSALSPREKPGPTQTGDQPMVSTSVHSAFESALIKLKELALREKPTNDDDVVATTPTPAGDDEDEDSEGDLAHNPQALADSLSEISPRAYSNLTVAQVFQYGISMKDEIRRLSAALEIIRRLELGYDMDDRRKHLLFKFSSYMPYFGAASTYRRLGMFREAIHYLKKASEQEDTTFLTRRSLQKELLTVRQLAGFNYTCACCELDWTKANVSLPIAAHHEKITGMNYMHREIKLIAVATDDRDEKLVRFVDSCQYFGFDVTVLGLGLEWKGGEMEWDAGGAMKVRLLRDYLRRLEKTFTEDTVEPLIMFTDSYDVVCNNNVEYLRSVMTVDFPRTKVLFTAEKTLWPDTTLEEHYPDPTSAEWKYLNSGGFVGLFSNVLAVVEGTPAGPFPTSDAADDQLYYTKKFLFEPDLGIQLDYDCKIFQSLADSEDDITIEKSHSVVTNSLTGTRPIVLHGNGFAKNFLERIVTFVPPSNFDTGKNVFDLPLRPTNATTLLLNPVIGPKPRTNYSSSLPSLDEVHLCVALEEMIGYEAALDTKIDDWPDAIFDKYTSPFHPGFVEGILNQTTSAKQTSFVLIPEGDDDTWSTAVRSALIDGLVARDGISVEAAEDMIGVVTNSTQNGASWCGERNATAFFYASANTILKNENTISHLFKHNLRFTFPIIWQPSNRYATFWPDQSPSGWYNFVPAYDEINHNHYRWRHSWPIARYCYLIRGDAFEKLLKEQLYSNTFRDRDRDDRWESCDTCDYIRISTRLRKRGVLLHGDNTVDFGFLLNHE